MRRVAIVGIGITPHGKYFPLKTWRELLADAVFEALEDAGGMSPKQIQHGTVAYHGEATIECGGIGAVVSDYLGISPGGVTPTCQNCVGSLVALHTGWNFVASGKYDRVLVSGFEKGGDLIEYFEETTISTDSEYDYMLGFMHRDFASIVEKYYQKLYGYDGMETFARWAVQCDWYAKRNPKAIHYKTPPLTMDLAMSPTPEGFVARTLAQGEGASAAILVPAEDAYKYNNKPIYLDAISYKCASAYSGNHFFYAGFESKELQSLAIIPPASLIAASQEAYEMAGITVSDIDLAQVYDMGGAGIIHMESLGIFPVGRGAEMVKRGETAIGGKCPANTDGGRIRFGHASGADGTDMIAESVIQLRGEAGERQVPNAKVAVCQSTGGPEAAVSVAVLKNE